MGRVRERAERISQPVAELFARNLVWDNHSCMPLRPTDETFLPQLTRFRDAGVDVVSLNAGFDTVPWENTVAMLAQFRRWVRERPTEYVLVEGVADIDRARSEGKLAVTFDIEGGCALNNQLSMVELYYELGVRWMLIAYNRNNSLGGGCNDEDTGLTPFGRNVLKEMQRVGMVACCSHTGYRTTMEVMEHAERPVIFSHSNPLGVWRHYRNIRDEAIKACAATGGVIGINGIGLFLGENDARTETIVRHIDYVVNLVGPAHVAIALDYVFDPQELLDYMRMHPEVFGPKEDAAGPQFVAPEQIPEIAEQLFRMGYSSDALRGILGGNHLRVAREVWRATPGSPQSPGG
jgi:membrane dipeptidase